MLLWTGDSAHDLAILMNSAYATLSDDKARQLYDGDLKHMQREVGTFDGRPVSAWHGSPGMPIPALCGLICRLVPS